MSVVWARGNMTNGELWKEGEEQAWYKGANRSEFQGRQRQWCRVRSVQSPPSTYP